MLNGSITLSGADLTNMAKELIASGIGLGLSIAGKVSEAIKDIGGEEVDLQNIINGIADTVVSRGVSGMIDEEADKVYSERLRKIFPDQEGLVTAEAPQGFTTHFGSTSGCCRAGNGCGEVVGCGEVAGCEAHSEPAIPTGDSFLDHDRIRLALVDEYVGKNGILAISRPVNGILHVRVEPEHIHIQEALIRLQTDAMPLVVTVVVAGLEQED